MDFPLGVERDKKWRALANEKESPKVDDLSEQPPPTSDLRLFARLPIFAEVGHVDGHHSDEAEQEDK